MRDDERFTKRELDRNEDPTQIAGAVGGATGAGVGGAIGAGVGGPIGAIVGILAGAAGGWWAGSGAQDAIQQADRADNRFRRAHEHAGATRPYEEVYHGYQLGYVAGRNPDHARAAFEDVEPDLRAAWVQAHVRDREPVNWEDVRDDVRAGYELAQEEARR